MQQFENAEIGARIAQARKETNGMTQEQLADLLNVSKRSVQDYEAGITMPWKHFQALQTVFGRSLHWFLHGEESSQGVDADVIEEKLDRIEQALEALVARLDPGAQAAKR